MTIEERLAAVEAELATIRERLDEVERCGAATRYIPPFTEKTAKAVCRRKAGHDGMHEGEGCGGASVVWDAMPLPKRDPAPAAHLTTERAWTGARRAPAHAFGFTTSQEEA